MTVPARQVGEDPQTSILRYITKQLDRLIGVIHKVSINPSLQLTSDEVNAIQNATSPSSSNVFATITDVPISLSDLSDDITHRVVTDTEKGVWNGKQNHLFNQYTAFISQTGTNAPTVSSLLKDDLSTPVWSYSAVGTYLLTKVGAFAVNKTVPNAAEPYTDVSGNLMTLERTSADVMTLKTYAAANTSVLANGVITNQFINIEIYL